MKQKYETPNLIWVQLSPEDAIRTSNELEPDMEEVYT